jgi:hypothetical protein
VGSKRTFFFSERFLTKILIFLSKNGILQSAKQFRKVDLDLWGQNATFFFQAFFAQNFDVFVKNNLSRSAKQFGKVDLDLWGQNATFFF